jgi:hypothetical protein
VRRGTAQLPAICWPRSMAATIVATRRAKTRRPTLKFRRVTFRGECGGPCVDVEQFLRRSACVRECTAQLTTFRPTESKATKDELNGASGFTSDKDSTTWVPDKK